MHARSSGSPCKHDEFHVVVVPRRYSVCMTHRAGRHRASHQLKPRPRLPHRPAAMAAALAQLPRRQSARLQASRAASRTGSRTASRAAAARAEAARKAVGLTRLQRRASGRCASKRQASQTHIMAAKHEWCEWYDTGCAASLMSALRNAAWCSRQRQDTCCFILQVSPIMARSAVVCCLCTGGGPEGGGAGPVRVQLPADAYCCAAAGAVCQPW